MNKIEKAREFRNMIDASLIAVRKVIRVDELTKEELFDLVNLYPAYQINSYSYKAKETFKYEGRLYKVIHDHLSNPAWVPSMEISLYTPVQPEGVIPEYTKPAGTHDEYHTGDRVIFEEEIWQSIVDHNSWSPIEYPQGWMKVELDGEGNVIQPDYPDDPNNEIPDFIKPIDTEHEYHIGDKVRFEEKIWICVKDNNSWSPIEWPEGWEIWIADPPEEPEEPEIPDFVQPAVPDDEYHIGDRVMFEGQVWESVIDNNSWSPTNYPAGWKIVEL